MFNAEWAEINRRLMLVDHGFGLGETGNPSAGSSGILALPAAASNDGAHDGRRGGVERQRAQLRAPTGGNIRQHLVDPGAQSDGSSPGDVESSWRATAAHSSRVRVNSSIALHPR
jgi:hypothetical protein